MRKILFVALASGFAIAAAMSSASAFVLDPIRTAMVSDVQPIDFICGPGRHVGYEGRHCWANHGMGYGRAFACPPGFHLGYRDRHCWPNR